VIGIAILVFICLLGVCMYGTYLYEKDKDSSKTWNKNYAGNYETSYEQL
jgi:hypothetical protein